MAPAAFAPVPEHWFSRSISPLMKSEFRPRRSPLSRTKHYLTFDDRLWRRLQAVADRHYGGNRSRAVEGLLLHDWLVETNKQRDGKPHTHWISAPLVMNDGELEPLLDRLDRGDADEIGCDVDRLVDERLETLKEEVSAAPDSPAPAAAPDGPRSAASD